MIQSDYSEEKLVQLEREISSGFDKERQEEKELDEIALEISSRCLKSSNKSCNQEYLGTEYKWELFSDIPMFNPDTKKYEFGFTLVCIDVVKSTIAGGKYIPLTASVPYEDGRTERDKLAATLVKSVLRHKAGKDIQVEELEED